MDNRENLPFSYLLLAIVRMQYHFLLSSYDSSWTIRATGTVLIRTNGKLSSHRLAISSCNSCDVNINFENIHSLNTLPTCTTHNFTNSVKWIFPKIYCTSVKPSETGWQSKLIWVFNSMHSNYFHFIKIEMSFSLIQNEMDFNKIHFWIMNHSLIWFFE